MADETGPAEALVTVVSKPPRAAGRALKQADDRLDEWVRGLSDWGAAAYASVMLSATIAAGAYAASLFLQVLLPRAAAQAGEADQIMCGTGFGVALTFFFTVLAAFAVILGIVRAVTALIKMSSARSDKKQEGKEQLTSSSYAFGAVFLLLAAPAFLDLVGLSTFSCITFAPF